MAYSEEQRRSALETFIRLDHSYADTIAELGYPNRGTLRGWWREYERTGVVPVRKSVSDPTYTDAMKRAAVDYYLGHGRSLASHSASRRSFLRPRSAAGRCILETAPTAQSTPRARRARHRGVCGQVKVSEMVKGAFRFGKRKFSEMVRPTGQAPAPAPPTVRTSYR